MQEMTDTIFHKGIVSIIIPIYNVEKYIDACILSVLNQSYQNIEIILVDDGSSDLSSAKCDCYANLDNRIKVIHKTNAGLGFARNSGLGAATGEFVMFVDGDDYIGPNYVENMYNTMIHSGADICIGGHTKVSRDGRQQVCVNSLAGELYTNDEIRYNVIPRLCGQNGKNDSIEMSVCMSIYRRNIIEDYAITFPSERELISEDFIFNLQFLFHTTKVIMSDSVLYYYRYNPTSLSHSYLSNRFIKQKTLYLTVTNMLTMEGIDDLCHQRNLDTFIGWVRGLVKSEQKEWRKIGLNQSISNIRRICEDSVLHSALLEYDDSYLSFKSRIVDRLIYKKRAMILWLISGFAQILQGSE